MAKEKIMKKEVGYSVCALFPNNKSTELLKFERKEDATEYASKCAEVDDGTMAFAVCRVETLVKYRGSQAALGSSKDAR